MNHGYALIFHYGTVVPNSCHSNLMPTKNVRKQGNLKILAISSHLLLVISYNITKGTYLVQTAIFVKTRANHSKKNRLNLPNKSHI